MDRKSILILVGCFVVLLSWNTVIVPRIYPRKPVPSTGTNAPAVELAVTNTPEATTTVVSNVQAAARTVKAIANTNVPEELVHLTNENAHYVFTSHGGGLKLVELTHYPETIVTRREKSPTTNRLARLNTVAPVPSFALLGGEALEGDGVYNLKPLENGAGVRAEKTLSNGLSIIKEFKLSTNYLVLATVTFSNASTEDLKLPQQELVVGTATPMNPQDLGQTVGVLWYNGKKAEDISAGWFENRFLMCFPGTPRSEFRGGQTNVVWVAAHNQFFTLVGMPQKPGNEVVIRKLQLPRPTGEDAGMVATNAAAPLGYETALVYPPAVLKPNEGMQREMHLFAGPKEYRTLARIADGFNNNVDLAMGFDRALGGRFTAFFARVLLLSMNAIHDLFKVGYGWVIIIITIVIKALFWPLTQASTRSMKRMQALQPQMAAIREKYKEDPLKMNRKTMEFMKEHKVSPLGGCLPMLLQMPVFIGLYVMIQSAIELRGSRFLWVNDLTQPDTLFIIPHLGLIPAFGIPGVGLPFNLLPLIMGATMLWQAHLTPPSPGMDPMQQKIMRYMPLMFMLFLYKFSAGLTLYWTVQNLLTILQTKLTRTAPEPAPVKKASVLTPGPKKRK
jgi:YidC/Oxa1 family membrane protein insertase